ncbi:MAG: hypothetical protein ACTS8P_01945 [Arsenophonus sp. NC-XBC3-MAG3]
MVGVILINLSLGIGHGTVMTVHGAVIPTTKNINIPCVQRNKHCDFISNGFCIVNF